MDLWLRLHFLFVGLFLCRTAPTPEECSQLVTPVLGRSQMLGSWKFLKGYTDQELFQNFLKDTDSSWVKFSNNNNSDDVVMMEYNRIKGRCHSVVAHIKFEDDTATVFSMNTTSVFHMLPSCPECLVLNITSTIGNLDEALKLLNMSHPSASEGTTAHSLYLMGRESTVKDADLELFKRQASCLGFSQDLNFQFNSEKEFCSEDESIKVFS